jgi:endonuclease-3
MQSSFAFRGRDDLLLWHRRLTPLLERVRPHPARRPVGQLVKSMISGRTRDAVSQNAYDRLVAAFGSPRSVAASDARNVQRVIRDVTFAETKAAHLVVALRRIAAERQSFDLDFLADLLLDDALAWLERLPGVGRKVAASTLNASTLSRPVLIVDSHVLRVLQRLGFVGGHADGRVASETATAALPDWQGRNFLDLHVALKLVGQIWCRPIAPQCDACPLSAACAKRLTE